MHIISVNKVEDCFDGSSVFRYQFDDKWTQESIKELDALGRLDYFADFPRPFFRVVTQDGLQVKGVEGEDNCQAIFPRREKETIKKRFEDQFIN